MTTYCVPDSITPRPIKPGVATVETIEAIMVFPRIGAALFNALSTREIGTPA